MPKKKHRRGAQRSGPGPRSHAASGTSLKRAERDRQALLAQFALWRRETVPQNQADDEASQVEPLLRLKAEQLESVDPSFWTEELIERLLTQVVPRKVVQSREKAMGQAPALGQFFAFLRARGRWHRESIDVERARQVLETLEFSVVEAADDPSRRSFSGNILSYADSLGVGLEEPGELDAFMQWYNTDLTDAERHEVSDTGRLANPTHPYEPRAAGAAGPSGGTGGSAFFPDAPDQGGPLSAVGPGGSLPDDAEDDSAPAWPWFLPEEDDAVVDPELATVGEDPTAVSAAHAQVPLVQRAERLLEFVGEGRQVTSTGALRLADVRTLVEDWGLDPGPRKLTSMWQIGELVGPWTTLVAGGWLTLTSTRVYRGDKWPVPYVPAEEDPEAFTDFARAMLTILLLTLFDEEGEDGGMLGGPDSFAALMCATARHGLTLPEPMIGATGASGVPRGPDGSPDFDELARLWRTGTDLAKLAVYGVLQRTEDRTGVGEHYQGNLAVMMAVVSVIDMMQGGDGPA